MKRPFGVALSLERAVASANRAFAHLKKSGKPMKLQSEATREDLLKRLRRVEGQVRGIHKMLEEERDCREIAQQLTAVQAALRSTTTTFLHAHARECLVRSQDLEPDKQAVLIDDLFGLLASTAR
jgi:CsoR family transcriptional regulator, copper-sensing transcriptional repressor